MEEKVSSLEYEEEHVHSVYEEIASHFSSTRYKPWPIVEQFLQDRPPGSIGLDVGCGNGKYLSVNTDVFILGSDRSTNLVHIARKHDPHDVVVSDILSIPHPAGMFDFAISIAVIHHLSTRERRIAAVASVLATLQPGTGRALLYVWALEQKESRRGWDKGDAQDVMVPWVRKGQKQSGGTGSAPEDEKVFQRYYHLYRQGELEEDIVAAGGVTINCGYEKDNWWAIAQR